MPQIPCNIQVFVQSEDMSADFENYVSSLSGIVVDGGTQRWRPPSTMKLNPHKVLSLVLHA